MPASGPGARMSGAAVHRVPPQRCRRMPRRCCVPHRAAARHALIATDGVFSMDGDLAPLRRVVAYRRATHDAWLLADDAPRPRRCRRGTRIGVCGGTQRSCPCRWARCPRPSAAMAAIVCASSPVIDLMKTRARTLIYSTGLAARLGRGRHRRARYHRERARVLRAAARQGAGVRRGAPGCPNRNRPSCR